MATTDKESLRSEFNRIKTALGKQETMTPELRTLFDGLIMLMELMLAIFLERKTKKTSANSSKPPSQTDKDESSLTQSITSGKGTKETSSSATNMRTVETTTIARVNACEHCGTSLEDVACDCYERRTRIDIIFEKTVEHVDAEIKMCSTCHKQTKAKHPPYLSGPLQYGNGIKAYVINLLVAQMLSLNRMQKMVKTLIGQSLSESTLLKFIMHLHLLLEGWEKVAVEKILTYKAIHTDETGLRVDKKNQWIHTYSAGDITLKFLHKNRGKKAIEAINIIPRYGGVMIHDCWPAYFSYKHCAHGLCGSHLLRELTFIVEANGYAWAKNMKCLLKEACKTVSSSKQKKMSSKKYANLQKRYRNILTRGAKELPAIPNKSTGRRGKVAKSDAHNLWERLEKHETAVLLFSKNSHVAFTNNRAEQDLRMSKVKQKVSGCFRTEKYAKAYCRITSFLQTMNRKGINPLIAIQMVLAGKIDDVAALMG